MNAKQMIEWVNESFNMSWGLPSLTLTQRSPLQVQNSGDCAELNIDDPDSDLDLEILDLEDLFIPYCPEIQSLSLQLRSQVQREELAHSHLTKASGRPRTL